MVDIVKTLDELAAVSFGSPETDFLEAVWDEVRRARAKFTSSSGAMCALTEEVGELAKAVLDEPWANVRAEAVQVAAMALRVALDGDPTLYPIRRVRGQQDGPSNG